ncbi:MAG: pimeloyl-ACP methyl ester esterase BioH [Gammaproteobacteria bacterium]|nr:pimeloyl-ACP methyl ester esterase BioH [Gammaproteobacteria bacterium]
MVLLHGWGLHSAVWGSVLPSLERHYRMTCLDLPGHGKSGLNPKLDDLDTLCEHLHQRLPSPISLVGWSLGGLIALAYALRYPMSVQRLVLVAATPRFVTADDWPAATPGKTLNTFAESLKRDYQLTIHRFLALQVRSSERAPGTLRQLRQALAEYPPHPPAMDAGLKLLRETDLRDQLPALRCATRLILGERDILVPKDCAEQIVSRLSDGAYMIIPGAGHAPFLSHPDEFNNALLQCLNH